MDLFWPYLILILFVFQSKLVEKDAEMERLLEDVASMKIVTQSLVESGDKALASSDKGPKRFAAVVVILGLFK